MIKKHKTKYGGSFFIRNIDPTVKAMFKSVCYRRNDHMKTVVETLMKLYAADPTIVDRKKKKKED